MPTNTRRAWELYLAYVIIMTAGRAYRLFTPESPEYLYFDVLNAFARTFSFPYVLALLQIVVTAFHWLPLALYIFQRPLGPRWFWQVILALWAILGITGNSYTKNILVSLYRNDPWLCFLTFLFMTLPYLPWYWACFRYAFVRMKTNASGQSPETSGQKKY